MSNSKELEKNNLKEAVNQVISGNPPDYLKGDGFLNLYRMLCSLAAREPAEYLSLFNKIDEYRMNRKMINRVSIYTF